MKITHPFIIFPAFIVLLLSCVWLLTKPKQVALPTAESTTAGPSVADEKASDPAPEQVTKHAPVEDAPVEEALVEDPDADIKAIIAERLKDPESARFQNIRQVSGDEVCGEVNSKNAFGGYVGFSAFWIKDPRGESPSVVIDSPGTTLAGLVCQGRGE